jgi:hypothetical protein
VEEVCGEDGGSGGVERMGSGGGVWRGWWEWRRCVERMMGVKEVWRGWWEWRRYVERMVGVEEVGGEDGGSGSGGGVERMVGVEEVWRGWWERIVGVEEVWRAGETSSSRDSIICIVSYVSSPGTCCSKKPRTASLLTLLQHPWHRLHHSASSSCSSCPTILYSPLEKGGARCRMQDEHDAGGA